MVTLVSVHPLDGANDRLFLPIQSINSDCAPLTLVVQLRPVLGKPLHLDLLSQVFH